MNVIYVSSDSPVKPCGGLGERLRKIFPFLEKLGMNLFVYTTGEGGIVSNTKCLGVDLVEVPDFGNPYPLFYTNFLLDNPPPFKPDIVIATDYPTIIPAKALARAYGAKLVTEFHLAYYSLRKIINEQELVGEMKLDQAARMVYLIEQMGAKSSDLIIGCSKKYIEDLPWQPKKAVAIQNGIDIENYDLPYEKYNFQGGMKKNIVFIGRMNTQKGVKHMFDFYKIHEGNRRMMAKIPDEYVLNLPEDTALHFVGGPIGGDQYEALLETVKYNKQKFHIPFVSGQEKINVLKSADAILFPSTHEPFGIVGLEAFASGVPLITTRVDGIADYSDDTNSIKCDASSHSIREAIDKLFTMPEEEKQKMVQNARETAKRFNWADISKQMHDELKALLQKSPE